MSGAAAERTWKEALADFFHPRVISMLFLGFSAGIPILLIFSSLSLWLREAGIERSAVTFFSWAALGYSFKFVWAPLVDRLPVPILTQLLGKRRAWLLVAQLAIMAAIFWMSATDPASGQNPLQYMAIAAVLLGFSSATQDIVIDAYRIEAAHQDSQAAMSSTYIAGYRIGMLVAGAGALFLASYWGSDLGNYSYSAWSSTYKAMALIMLLGVITTLIIPEPARFRRMSSKLSPNYLLALIVLLFTGNELAFAASDSSNTYYLGFMWLSRVAFLVLALRVISLARQSTQDSLLDTNELLNTGLILLWLSMFTLGFSSFINQAFYLWGALIALAVLQIAWHIRQRAHYQEENLASADNKYTTNDYLRFLLLFVIAVTGFITAFYFSKGLGSQLKGALNELLANKHLASFIVETLRLAFAVVIAFLIARLAIRGGVTNQQMVDDTYVAPVRDFFTRYGTNLALLLLLLVGFYRISDIVLGVISNVFYQDLGFTKPEIASIVKTFGLFMTIAGGFLGGLLSTRYGVIRILFLGALLSAVTNLLFMLLAKMGHDITMLYLVISADNLSGGLATAAFIAFLSSMTNIRFTAVQYAIFSSLMTLLPKIIGGYSGSMVDGIGYENFFLITAIMGIPVLVLIWITADRFELKTPQNAVSS